MECNKDEALRARQIAETKMQRGDFEGGQKFALKAKNMYAEVENIAQMLTVCEIHIAAKNKLSGGSDIDWYGILQTGQLADEATIKKQYRKLALLLHPDKNKFAGAEAAFKLIGEANRVLGDKANRSLYDKKYKVSVRPRATKTSPYNSNGNAFAAKHDGNGTSYQNNSFSNPTSNARQKAEPYVFWTICKNCNAMFQYTKNILNATLRCPKCLIFFTAPDLGNPDIPPVFPQASFGNKNWKEAPKAGAPKPAPESNGGGHADNFVPASTKKCAGAGVGGRRKSKKTTADSSATGRAKGTVPASKGAKGMGSQGPKKVGSKRVRPSAPDSMQKPDVSNVETGEDDLESPPKMPRQNEPFNTNAFEKREEPVSGGFSNDNNPACKECKEAEVRKGRAKSVKSSGVGNSEKCGGTEVMKESESNSLNGVEERQLMEAVEELKLKLGVLEAKLNEAGVTISK